MPSMTLLRDPYPEVERTALPPAPPLHQPTLAISSTLGRLNNQDKVIKHSKSNISNPSVRYKRESYNLSGSTFLVTASGMTLNLPVPSASRLDPLNWSRKRTFGAMLALVWYFVASSTIVQAPSVILPGIATEFSKQSFKPRTMESIVTAPTLFMGIGALLWLPLSLALGRRPIFLLTAIMMPFAALGAGISESFHALLAFVCLLGLGHGFSVTSAFLMVIDMTFIHQRPQAVALLWALGGGAGTGLLAIVPYLSPAGAWRQFYYCWSALMAVGFFLALLLYPETYFKRPTVAFDGLILLQSATEKLTIYKDLDLDSEIYRDLPELPFDSDCEQTLCCRLLDRLRISRSPATSWKSTGYCFIQMLRCAVNPLIFWVFLASSVHWASILFIGATYTSVLRSPPYSLPSSMIININTSSAIGAFLAYPIGGWLIDRVLKRMAQRNHGIREAEHYLIGYIPSAIIGACGALLYGFAVQYKLHYTLHFLSCGLEAFSWITLCITNTLWLTEAFPRWAAPAVAVSGGACYVFSFAIGFGLVPWISAHGYKLVGIELAALQIVAGLVAVPVAFWGKSIRQAINGRWADERSGALRPL